MEACNVVRMRVRPGFEAEFLAFNDPGHPDIPGMLDAWLVQTGERDFCYVARWVSRDALVAGRGPMVAELDQMRHMLEDLGPGLGVTDPASGEIVSRKRTPVVPFRGEATGVGVASELGR
ncbi:hypothetical protein Rumeso_02539 [Rubellimicrobium mesophilum DSM 19309]|uniref:ABM domain-containing protein n=1 Tax=Rubellimicrobium mesophilum DSM 19309 TaxID=442562 RepID=A0A017HNH6_9RHOB|nr:hypothetical protein [Rubellimicrobium mesophilum]EYD75921.1 hypothetical protein Rumeso_02539 [Rubellimicrobium mesophilum DSM 19309]